MLRAKILLVSILPIAMLWLGSRDVAAANVITSPDTPGRVGDFTSLALDDSDNPVISYYDSTNGDLKVVHCGDPTCTTGNSITSPDTAGEVGLYTSLALDTGGHPVVSYYDATNENLKVLHCGDPNCASGNIVTTPDQAGDVGLWTSLTLDGLGRPVISYYDVTNGDLKVLHCGGAFCTGGNVITSPDTAGDVGYTTSLASDAIGNPVISYLKLSPLLVGELRVMHCGDPNCSSGNVIASVDTGAGAYTSLALDGSGNPVASYFDPFGDGLKVLHCGDPNCGSGNVIASPDPDEDDSGLYSSLELDSSGSPVVSYYDLDQTVRVLHCGDPNCGAGNSIASPDNTLDSVGEWTSLALDAGGNPVVSYSDSTNGDLKVLHCGDPRCGATPPPAPVGGVVSVQTDGERPVESPSEGGGGRALPLAVLAAVAGGITIGAGGWYVRRRWHSR